MYYQVSLDFNAVDGRVFVVYYIDVEGLSHEVISFYKNKDAMAACAQLNEKLNEDLAAQAELLFPSDDRDPVNGTPEFTGDGGWGY